MEMLYSVVTALPNTHKHCILFALLSKSIVQKEKQKSFWKHRSLRGFEVLHLRKTLTPRSEIKVTSVGKNIKRKSIPWGILNVFDRSTYIQMLIFLADQEWP